MTIGHAADTLRRLPNENIPVNLTANVTPYPEAQGTRNTTWYVFRRRLHLHGSRVS
jgi:hypothetical protein